MWGLELLFGCGIVGALFGGRNGTGTMHVTPTVTVAMVALLAGQTPAVMVAAIVEPSATATAVVEKEPTATRPVTLIQRATMVATLAKVATATMMPTPWLCDQPQRLR